MKKDVLCVKGNKAKAFSLVKEFDLYDDATITIKPNDKSYEIYSITGRIFCNNIKVCINYFFEYVEFNNEQKYYIRKTTKEYKNWNSNSELPKLKNLLLEVESLDKEDTSKDIEKIIREGRLLFKNNNFFYFSYSNSL